MPAPLNRSSLPRLRADLLNGERHRRVRQIDRDIDTFLVEPFARNRGADIGLVLVIGDDQFDGRAGHRAAEFRNRHFRRRDGAWAAAVRERPAHVGEDADLDLAVGDLGMRRACERQQRNTDRHAHPLHDRPLQSHRRVAAMMREE